MNDEPEPRDGADAELVGRLLDGLAQSDGLEGETGDDEARTRRGYRELLGLIGASVEPVEPPPALRERLLAAVAEPAAAVVPGVVVAMPPPAAGTTPAGLAASRWALPLAASLALAFAGFAGYQASQLAGQRATIERLSERLEAVETRTPTVAAMRARLAEMQEQMALITAKGVEICPLRPMSVEPALTAGSRGVLYVAADHQHWYLTIEGLKPCRQGRSYQLWFVTADGEPVSAGTFDVGEGVRVELSSETMPAATRAISVTLEPPGGSPRPSGPAVLHGDQVMAVL